MKRREIEPLKAEALYAERSFKRKGDAVTVDEHWFAPQTRFKALPQHLVLWSWSAVLRRSWRNGSSQALMKAGWKHKAQMHYTRVCWEQTLVTVQGVAITLRASAWEGRSFPTPPVERLGEMCSTYFTKLLFVGWRVGEIFPRGRSLYIHGQTLQPKSSLD